MSSPSSRLRPTRRTFLLAGAAAGGATLVERSLFAAVAPVPEIVVHVSLSGDDKGDGSVGRPLATLVAARERARRLAKSGKVTVQLGRGTYELPTGLQLTAADSGTADAPVTWRSAEGAAVTLTASRRLKASQFRTVASPAALARIPKELHGKILELDLASAGIRNVQRYPDLFTDNGGLIELFADDKRLPLARYPKQGYMQMKEVVVNGGGMEASGDWKSFYDAGAKDQHKPRPGVFVYRDERAERWIGALDRGVWLKGYWRVPWQNESVRVAAIDPQKKTIQLAAPVAGGIGSKYHRPKGSGQENYWVFNLLEELSEPGEWCVDFKDKKLYLYPPGPLDSIDLRVADNQEAVLQLRDASHVNFVGLGIGGSRVDGVHVSGGTQNLIAGCAIRNTTRYGVRFENGSRHKLLSSEVYATGAGGVWLGGGDETSTPRVPAGHEVVNCHIHHFGEIERVYAPGINAGFTGGGAGGHHAAVGMRVANNLIHDGPHAGILHGSWDHVFEYNEIFRVCRISNDMGYFYCYDNYDRSGNRTFRYNFMHNSPLADGIYFDNDHRQDKVYGNLVNVAAIGFLYKIQHESYNPMQVFCWNNLAVNCTTGFRFAMREGSDVKNNAAVLCKTPYIFLKGHGEPGPDPEGDLSTGKNMTLDRDPGFVDMAAGNFRLKPDSDILKGLAFQPIPFERIGLFRDAYRTSLPSDASLKRFSNPDQAGGSAYDIQDR